MEGTTRTKRVEINEYKEPKTAKKLPIRKGHKPAKMQLEDGITSLKEYLEMKAKFRGNHPESKLLCTSNTGQSDFIKGEDDSSTKMDGGICDKTKP